MVRVTQMLNQHTFRFTLRWVTQSESSLDREVAIKLHLDIQQRNNLRTGVRLATELTPTRINHRMFITVKGYGHNKAGRRISLKNVLNGISLDEIYFEVRCYEISNDFYTNRWDVTEDDVFWVASIDDIKGITKLEEEVLKYVQDFSSLIPEWHCDNLL